jgi:hypothetical protein
VHLRDELDPSFCRESAGRTAETVAGANCCFQMSMNAAYRCSSSSSVGRHDTTGENSRWWCTSPSLVCSRSPRICRYVTSAVVAAAVTIATGGSRLGSRAPANPSVSAVGRYSALTGQTGPRASQRGEY